MPWGSSFSVARPLYRGPPVLHASAPAIHVDTPLVLEEIGALSGTRRPAWTDGDFLLPCAVAALLAFPCIRLGYFWDDFAFLTRVQTSPLSALRYQPGTAFYRPLSQGLYFVALSPLGSSGSIVAHLVNLALLLTSIALLVAVVRGIAGRRAGVLAGLLFAGFAPAAGLVAWASGSQDLLAIVFLLAAIRLHDQGRTGWAVVAAAAGLLSKETIAAAFPVLILWHVILGRRPARLARCLLLFGGLVLAWGLLHPGIRLFLNTGFFVHERPGYLGFRNLAVTELNARRYVLTLFNLPATGWTTPWPKDRAAYGAAAVIVAVAGTLLLGRRPRGGPDGRGDRVGAEASAPQSPQLSLARVAVLGALLTVPMLILPSLIIQRWVAYYACLPALGTSIFLGALGARAPLALTSVALAAYLALGIWSRGVEDPSGAMMTERSFVLGSKAIQEVERGFRDLHPALPRGSRILVSVASSGMAGIHGTLVQGQAPRIWYRDSTVQTLTPERRRAGAPAEFLFRITSARSVVEIFPDRLAYRSSGLRPEDQEVRAVIRTYARGLAASGERERSVIVLEQLAQGDPSPLRSYDLRLAAMARYAGGERAEAERLRAAAPAIPRDYALDAIAKVMAEPTRNAALDSSAYWAFGISPKDPDALRYWMAMFFGSEYYPQAIDFARRLQAAVPGDPESAAILRRLGPDAR